MTLLGPQTMLGELDNPVTHLSPPRTQLSPAPLTHTHACAKDRQASGLRRLCYPPEESWATMGARLPLFLLLALLGSSRGAGEGSGLDTGSSRQEAGKGSWRDGGRVLSPSRGGAGRAVRRGRGSRGHSSAGLGPKLCLGPQGRAWLCG